ncbi:hypothetical protein RQ479_29535 [Mesorhizobium sp. ISC25]|uniref:hypothetical protein n=1 Tax=Mesorhizobium sp. ISC25 TaxID=3077335 RepID=UPI0035DBB6BA
MSGFWKELEGKWVPEGQDWVQVTTMPEPTWMSAPEEPQPEAANPLSAANRSFIVLALSVGNWRIVLKNSGLKQL